MQQFTIQDLGRYTGKNGNPAYIAYQGKVYDVSNSWYWKQGIHQAIHPAGQDYTGRLDEAPHSAELLERVPVVGILI